MRSFLLWVLGVLVALILLLFVGLRVPFIQDRILDEMISANLKGEREGLFKDDALRVFLCGTSSPMPHRSRAKSCLAVFAGGRFWIVDAGPGSWNQIALAGWDVSRIGGVMLTHFHADHIGDLGELNTQTWAAGRNAPLVVYGPPGVEEVVEGFTKAYALDADYRVAHHGRQFMPPDSGRMEARVVESPAYGEGPRLVLEDGDLRITAFPVRHDPVKPAYGYRFDYGDRSIVVSGDTAKSPALIDAAQGADLLIHDAQASHIVSKIGEIAGDLGRPRIARIMEDILDYHSTPTEAAESANEAGVQMLILVHLSPPPPNKLLDSSFTRGVDQVRPNGWLVGDDGMFFTLPLRSTTIQVD